MPEYFVCGATLVPITVLVFSRRNIIAAPIGTIACSVLMVSFKGIPGRFSILKPSRHIPDVSFITRILTIANTAVALESLIERNTITREGIGVGTSVLAVALMIIEPISGLPEERIPTD